MEDLGQPLVVWGKYQRKVRAVIILGPRAGGHLIALQCHNRNNATGRAFQGSYAQCIVLWCDQ